MAKHKGKAKIAKRERALPQELRRAVKADKITKERALRLVESGGEVTEHKIADQNNAQPLRINETTIDWLIRRAHITPSMWYAAVTFREHFDRSGLEQLRAMDPTKDVVDGGNAKPEPLFRDKHLTQFNAALRQLGPLSSPVVTNVVLRDVRPEDCRTTSRYKGERDRRTEAMTMLCDGLARLAVHFRLPKDW
jgi:hypothetical protein